jgi:hypothetical protein
MRKPITIITITIITITIIFCVVSLNSRSKISNSEDISDISSKWNTLLSQGGCLVGSEDWDPNGLGEGTCLRESRWQEFFNIPLTEAVPCLIERIGSQESTNIHVCPFQNATEGEMAVYTLQHFLKTNWIEMSSNNEVIREAIALHNEHRQEAIRKILDNSEARNELKEYFVNVSKEKKH